MPPGQVDDLASVRVGHADAIQRQSDTFHLTLGRIAHRQIAHRQIARRRIIRTDAARGIAGFRGIINGHIQFVHQLHQTTEPPIPVADKIFAILCGFVDFLVTAVQRIDLRRRRVDAFVRCERFDP